MNETSSEDLRIERLIALANRLIEALESDIAALKAGNTSSLRTIDPEIQKLSALYGREAARLKADEAVKAPLALRKRLFDATSRFRELLGAQTRLLTRLRGASEGIVRAVADEIERQRAPMRTYGAAERRPASGSSLLYNAVV
jgi:hypothetical protein